MTLFRRGENNLITSKMASKTMSCIAVDCDRVSIPIAIAVPIPKGARNCPAKCWLGGTLDTVGR